MSDLTRRRVGIGLIAAGLLLGLVHFGVVPVPQVVESRSSVEGVALVYESSQGIPGGFLADKVESLLRSSGVPWRRADKDTPFADEATAAQWSPFIAAAGAELPAVVTKSGGKFLSKHVDGGDSDAIAEHVRKAVSR